MNKSDIESSEIFVVPHCIFNKNVRLIGLSSPPSFDVSNKSVIQLPCPEAIYLGLDRREITKEQLQTPEFMRFCKKLFTPYADMIEMLYNKGFKIYFLGIPKSPSCAAKTTSVGGLGGKGVIFENQIVSGTGVFFEQIKLILEERGVNASFYDIE
ncbi:MAG: hypothetical protein GX362_02320 [Methanosarcinaceae archaeon]|nr:hypothetical protein [Methanosarcinaceae archaeon]